jgi:hypothetical protein
MDLMIARVVPEGVPKDYDVREPPWLVRIGALAAWSATRKELPNTDYSPQVGSRSADQRNPLAGTFEIGPMCSIIVPFPFLNRGTN